MKKSKTRSEAAKKGWETRRKNMARALNKKAKLARKEAGKLLLNSKKKKSTKKHITLLKARPLTTPVVSSWFGDKGMNQIYSSGFEFAFVSKDGRQCHPFAFCKDYLQDAIHATLWKTSNAIYGFKYTHGQNPPLDMDFTRIAVRYKGSGNKFKGMCQNTLKFINEIDKTLGFQQTIMEYGGNYKDGKDEVYIFVGDKRWMLSPVLISLFTLALRVGLSYEGGDWMEHFKNAKKYVGRNDKSYTKAATPAVEKIVNTGVKELFPTNIKDNYSQNIMTSALHNNSGIVSMGNRRLNANIKVNA